MPCRTRIELQVESDWRESMQRHCYNERLLRHRYEYYGQHERAAAVELKSCKELAAKFSAAGAAAGTAGGGGVSADGQQGAAAAA